MSYTFSIAKKINSRAYDITEVSVNNRVVINKKNYIGLNNIKGTYKKHDKICDKCYKKNSNSQNNLTTPFDRSEDMDY